MVVDKPMTVLMDNCKIHNALVTQEVIERLNINVLSCVLYRPDLNAIEFVRAIVKQRFRQLLRMMGTLQLSLEESVDQAAATRE